MKRGRLRTHHDYKIDKWIIQGRRNNNWTLVSADIKEKGKFENLIFDLEYDACGFLEGWTEWQREQAVENNILGSLDNTIKKVIAVDKKKKKQRNKAAKKARKQERKK